MSYGIKMPGAPGVVPGRAVHRRRPHRWLIVLGVAIALAGLALTVVGAVGMFALDARAAASPTVEGRVPDAVEFDADRATYEILLVQRRSSNLDLEAADTTCVIRLADGRHVEVDGRVQGVSVSGRGTATVGSFRAVDGVTVVQCIGADDGRTFVIDEVSAAERWAVRSTLLGVAALVAGIGTALLGVFWRRAPA
ncbi:MAG: hypothetical protein ACLGHQ_13570 [Acidimicrobiia bacterium]